MALNKSKGNMYEFVTHTFNVIKGECFHDCKYCYMKRWGKLNPVRFDSSELKTDLGSGNFIFVGSSTDMFAENIPSEWIQKVIDYCNGFNNRYVFQTKYPERFHKFKFDWKKFILGTTIETNRVYDQMGNTPYPLERAYAIGALKNNETFVTIEPVLDFDHDDFLQLIEKCNVEWVNIGADSSGSGLPEPGKENLENFIESLSGKVVLKSNLNRIRK